MEDLIINVKEHRLLRKFQNQLEKCYGVKICMPKVSESNSHSDMVFISIKGEEPKIECVKKFLSEKMNVSKRNDCKENYLVITLSDSEDETSVENDSVCLIDSSSSFPNASGSSDSFNDSVCIIDSSASTCTKDVMKNSSKHNERKRKKCFKDNPKKKKKVRSDIVLSPEVSCEVTSTTSDVVTKKFDNSDESIIILNETIPRSGQEFIPLINQNRKTAFENMGRQNQQNSSNSFAVANMVPVVRSLRPIVIDGSNVAIEHGKWSKCFSSRGIQLAIEFFLERGHTNITAFVPKFRQHIGENRTYPTKNPEILSELEKKQFLVFTPCRRLLNGESHIPYDDRFIVKLAAESKGVIISNDNYRDLLRENDSYKEAIEKRLLMFCFVGDKFMVPEDPLGWKGPKLLDFLSLPPDDDKK